jgi:DNA-directed RNA polymerase subunit M/transcription elongation factor TFIIS
MKRVKFCPRCGSTKLDKVIDTENTLMCDECEFTENKNNFLEAEKDKVEEEFEKSQEGIEYETPGH